MKDKLLKYACISGAGLALSFISYNFINTKNKKRTIKTMEINNNFDEVFIKDSSVPINLVQSIEDSIHVTLFENDHYYYEIHRVNQEDNEENNKLIIEFKQNVNFFKEFFLRCMDKEYYLEVGIPHNLYVKISAVNNNIYIDGVKANGMNIKNINGKIEVKNTKTKNEIDLKNTNSSIKVKNIKCNDLFVNNSNGKMFLNNVDVDSAIKIKNTNGSIVLKNTNFNTDSSVTTMNGKINISLRGNEKDYCFETNNLNNTVFLNGTKIQNFEDYNGNKKLEVTSTNGKINIDTK